MIWSQANISFMHLLQDVDLIEFLNQTYLYLMMHELLTEWSKKLHT